jgi:hypothetical protein
MEIIKINNRKNIMKAKINFCCFGIWLIIINPINRERLMGTNVGYKKAMQEISAIL